MQYSKVDVMLEATRRAQSRDGANGGPKELIFDIVLEENVMGVPVSALPLVIFAVGAVAVSCQWAEETLIFLPYYTQIRYFGLFAGVCYGIALVGWCWSPQNSPVVGERSLGHKKKSQKMKLFKILDFIWDLYYLEI